jgi:hypothetical protein
MSAPCIFCNNNSGSREHLWPKWILTRSKFGPLRHQIRKREAVIIRPEVTVKTVCQACNSGWMSALESECIPVIGSMLQGLTVPLSQEQQETVADWAVKTAMIMDSLKGRDIRSQLKTHHHRRDL